MKDKIVSAVAVTIFAAFEFGMGFMAGIAQGKRVAYKDVADQLTEIIEKARKKDEEPEESEEEA